jgi:hypothetical protein
VKKSFFILAFISFTTVELVFACSCGTVPFNEAVESADEIFIGRVLKLEQKQRLFSFEPRDYWVAHFEVSEKWKGTRKSKVKVAQTYNSCSFNFYFDTEYLVYAMKTNFFNWNGTRKYTTWLCSRTIETIYYYDWAKEDWTWDDREKLNNEFPSQVQVSSIYNNLPLWIAMLFVLTGFALFKFWNRK